ncbi:pilus assembly protein [Aquitalea sp. ASV11]|uniref:pilus assembly protein n=1 Tax=Aquitalea sp. ASV11 TaxID=2795103 RepID=UPI0018ECB534|nr:PilC/PilY family type IV pilus protein [Aquitalea sp. ASV11]
MSRSVTACTAAVLALFSATVFAANPYPTVPLYLDQVTAKPNVAVLVDDSGSMVCQPSDTSGCSRDKSVSLVNNSTTYVAKIRLAKTALNSLFSNNFDIARWSLFKFRTIIPSSYTSGGNGIFYTAGSSKLLADWNTSNGLSDFTTAVNSLVPAGSTPSASAFYNVMQYFYGNSSYGANTYQRIVDSNYGNPYFWNSGTYNGIYSDSGQSYTSPIQYVCQKNFVIFVSDGQPNQENGDILTATATNPKDGHSYTISNYVNTKNLLTGYTSDVRNTTVVNYAAFYHDAGVVPNGKTKDNEGNNFDATTSPPITTYTIGLGLASGDTGRTVLQAMAEAGGGQYFDTSDQTSLTNALQSILNSIKTQTATNVPVVASKPTNPTDAIQATFYSGDWSGQLRAYSVSSTTGLANLTSPIPVLFNSSSATRLANIFTSTGASASGALYTSVSSDSNLNSYLSGGSPSGWRSRGSDKSTPSTLGDIIDSTPTPFGTTATAGFAVGANDGMLHVFGRTTSNYTEVFSYIPRAVTAANLALLGSTTYGAAQPHLYFVNGNLTFNNVSGGDNQFSTSTTSVLTGGMAQGGQGLFALDISNTVANPSLLTGGSVFGAGNVLWDHVPTDSGFTNLGYTFAKPVIAQVYYGGKKKWAMITGNGYDSTNKATTLMVIDLKTGAMLYEIDTGTASNGLSSPAVLDVDGDKVADYVYAGDQSGNVWRFKLQTSSDQTTSVSKFFTAQANQPIVAAPAIYAIPGGGYMVYVGTGRMMYENTSYNDRTTVYPQSLYGIYDDQTKTNLTYSSSTFITDAEVANLNGTASIDGSTTSTASGKLGSSVVFRETTTISDAATTGGLSVGPSGNRAGWVFNMNSTNGERMLYQPVVALGKLYFTTQVLKGSSLVCSNVNQQSGWVMALDLMTGGAPSTPAFDLNGDGKINTSTTSPDGDTVSFTDKKTNIPSGINYNIGIPSALSIAFTVTTVNLGDYTSTDGGQLGSYPYPSSTNTNEVLTFYVGGTGGSNGNVAAGKLIPKATSVGRRIGWREIF